jgi:hypothetical protein
MIGEWGYFRIYDIALTAGQVLDQYNANVNRFYPPVPAPPGVINGRTFGQGFAG